MPTSITTGLTESSKVSTVGNSGMVILASPLFGRSDANVASVFHSPVFVSNSRMVISTL